MLKYYSKSILDTIEKSQLRKPIIDPTEIVGVKGVRVGVRSRRA